MNMPALVLVEGTWVGDWARPGSHFRTYVARQGFRLLSEPFEWSHDVAGLPRAISWWTTNRHSDWRAGGASLRSYLRGLRYEDRNVIAHSHGGQVALFAAGHYDVPIRRLITVATPCRGDLEALTLMAKPRIGHWTHVSSADGDLMARLGQLFDGRLRRGRTQPLADVNVRIPKMGHTGVLTDPRLFHHLDGLLDTIRWPDAAIGARVPAVPPAGGWCDTGADVPGGGAA